MKLPRDLPLEKRALFESLTARSDMFHKWSRARKLVAHPYRFIESEYSVRSRSVLARRASTFWGGSMNVYLPEPVSTFLYRYGYFEEGLSAFFLAVLQPGNRFLDIGSHYGYFSLLARHLVGPEGGVVALEPTPSTFSVNRSNTRAYTNITVENTAAWSSPTTARLSDLGVAWSSHNSLLAPKMVPTDARTSASQIEVPCVKLDDFLSALAFSPDLVKIDAESAELEILRGMEKTLRTTRPMITLEVGDEDGPTQVKSADAVRFCAQFDYLPYRFVDRSIEPHGIQGHYSYDNLFMIPREKSSRLIGS
jgi:FkbM family methyltransferase